MPVVLTHLHVQATPSHSESELRDKVLPAISFSNKSSLFGPPQPSILASDPWDHFPSLPHIYSSVWTPNLGKSVSLLFTTNLPSSCMSDAEGLGNTINHSRRVLEGQNGHPQSGYGRVWRVCLHTGDPRIQVKVWHSLQCPM